MKHQELRSYFPFERHKKVLPNQEKAMAAMDGKPRLTAELPTGSGKTALGIAFLRWVLATAGKGPVYYVTPNKTLVSQVRSLHPEVKVMFGRNEYPCLFYGDKEVSADECPCSMLKNCPHRVDQLTGETFEGGVKPCPYLQQKYEVSCGGIVVCSTAYYLFNFLFRHQPELPAGIVIDEVHQLAEIARNCLSYEITDYHLFRSVELLESVDAQSAESLKDFAKTMIRIVKKKPTNEKTVLEDKDILKLIEKLSAIDPNRLSELIQKGIDSGRIDVFEDRKTLRRLEILIKDLRRYLKSLGYAVADGLRQPLDYAYAYWQEEKGENEKVYYRLFIKCYYLRPLLKRIYPEKMLAYSATIGDPEVLDFETGIDSPFVSLDSDFSSAKTRLFMPSDTPNLAMNARGRQDKTRVLRKIVKAARSFAEKGKRSLIVVISNEEKDKVLMLAKEEGLEAVSYGNGVKPRQAADKFKSGQGDCLVGTAANFGEGIDLPKGQAPVIFFLRPGYPVPSDPASVFEERRFGSQRWKLWNWRVMMEALQVRGRNIRGHQDVGVCFFVSQQFRRFLYGSLPEWLRKSYRSEKSFDDCVAEAMELLQ